MEQAEATRNPKNLFLKILMKSWAIVPETIKIERNVRIPEKLLVHSTLTNVIRVSNNSLRFSNTNSPFKFNSRSESSLKRG